MDRIYLSILLCKWKSGTVISTKNPAHEIRCLIIESLSVQRGNRNYCMKSSDGIIENTVSFKMLKYNSCKIQSYGISWSLKYSVVLGNCYAEVITVKKKRGVFGSNAWFRLWLTAGHVSHITGIWVKKSVTREMHDVLRIVNSEHDSDRRLDMSIPQTLLIGFDLRGRDKKSEKLLRL